MKAELVKKEGNKVTLKITVDNNKFEEAVNKAYNKTKGKYNIPGFRKGKAPKVVIETQYGKGVFYNDAIDMLFPEVYPEAIKELNIDPIDRPDLDIEEISKDNGLVMVVNVEVKPEFELGAYKGIEISKVDNTVSEEDVEARLNEMVNRNARLTSVEDKALENGDTAVIDFEGFKNGVAFEGGKGENYNLVIGSNTFIPGFEDQLVGKKLAAQTGATGEQAAKEVENADVVSMKNVQDIFNGLSSNQYDAAIVDLGVAKQYVSSGNFTQLNGSLMDEKNYVIAKKGNTKMIKLMNKCIKKFLASKDYDKLCKKYDLSPLEK